MPPNCAFRHAIRRLAGIRRARWRSWETRLNRGGWCKNQHAVPANTPQIGIGKHGDAGTPLYGRGRMGGRPAVRDRASGYDWRQGKGRSPGCGACAAGRRGAGHGARDGPVPVRAPRGDAGGGRMPLEGRSGACRNCQGWRQAGRTTAADEQTGRRRGRKNNAAGSGGGRV